MAFLVVAILAVLALATQAETIERPALPDLGNETIPTELEEDIRNIFNRKYNPQPTKEPLPLHACWDTHNIDGARLPVPILSKRVYAYCTVLLTEDGWNHHGYNYDPMFDAHIYHQFSANPKMIVAFHNDVFKYYAQGKFEPTNSVYCRRSGCNVPLGIQNLVKYNTLDKADEIAQKINEQVDIWGEKGMSPMDHIKFSIQMLDESDPTPLLEKRRRFNKWQTDLRSFLWKRSKPVS